MLALVIAIAIALSLPLSVATAQDLDGSATGIDPTAVAPAAVSVDDVALDVATLEVDQDESFLSSFDGFGGVVSSLGAYVLPGDRLNDSNLTVYFENDLFAGSDQDYTNGTRLSWLSRNLPGEEMPRVSRTIREAFNFGCGGKLQLNYGFSLQQLMFTPADITVSDLQPNDRPYAGWTAVGVSLHAKTLDTIRSLELSVGVVGESAYAQETQDWVHDWRNIPKAQGWEHQLQDEAAINLFLTTQHRFRRSDMLIPGLEWDFLPRRGIALGNVLTAADIGVAFRLGYNLPENFADQKLSPTAYNQEIYYDDKGRKIRKGKFSFYLFGGADAEAKAWDIFLDGNTYQGSHNVTKNYFVGELEAGFGIRLWDSHITYTHTFRSQEFRSQQDDPEFGSIAVTIPF